MGMADPTGSEGIYVFRRDATRGALTAIQTIGAVNPTFLALDRSERFLFCVNEVREFRREQSGAVTSYAIDSETGALRLISQVASGGGNPCHLSISGDGRFLLVANHEAGSVAVFPIAADGQLSDRVDLHVDQPADERQSHAHFITADPDGRFVLATNTGTDRISVYRQDEGTGRLTAHTPPFETTHPGGSPRHLAFSPSGRHVFVNGEGDLTLSVLRYDPAAGTLDYRRHVDTVPDDAAKQGHSTAQMLAHPDGPFVYVANRGPDTIAIIRFDEASERLTPVAFESTRGRTPRNFQFDPGGRWLYTANQNSNSIHLFSLDPSTGALRHRGQVATVPAPTCLLFTRT